MKVFHLLADDGVTYQPLQPDRWYIFPECQTTLDRPEGYATQWQAIEAAIADAMSYSLFASDLGVADHTILTGFMFTARLEEIAVDFDDFGEWREV